MGLLYLFTHLLTLIRTLFSTSVIILSAATAITYRSVTIQLELTASIYGEEPKEIGPADLVGV
jgi:hypothetical protein